MYTILGLVDFMDSLEHVDHVVQVDEGVVDGDHLGPLLQSRPVYQAKIYSSFQVF